MEKPQSTPKGSLEAHSETENPIRADDLSARDRFLLNRLATRGETIMSLSEVTSRSLFIVREHIEELAAEHLVAGNPLPPGTAAKTFHYLVDGLGQANFRIDHEGKLTRDPMPPEGVILKERETLGMPPHKGNTRQLDNYTKSMAAARFAIQAGSIIDFSKKLDDTKALPPARKGIKLLGERLEGQLFQNDPTEPVETLTDPIMRRIYLDPDIDRLAVALAQSQGASTDGFLTMVATKAIQEKAQAAMSDPIVFRAAHDRPNGF